MKLTEQPLHEEREALRPWLEIWNTTRPQAGGERARLPWSGRFVIGKLSVCDLIIEDDEWVSRRHIELDVHAGEVKFLDLGSMNGVLLNNKPATTGLLREGDTLRLGDTCLQLHCPQPGKATKRRLGPRPPGMDTRFDPVRAAVSDIDFRFDGNLIMFRREPLDALLAEKLNVLKRQARRLLDEFAKELGVPSEVVGSDRWQAVADICAGRNPGQHSGGA
jgi:hypothetical protein